MLTLQMGVDQFLREVPEGWRDEGTKRLLQIAFASGAYTAANIAKDQTPDTALTQARELCNVCEAMLEDIRH